MRSMRGTRVDALPMFTRLIVSAMPRRYGASLRFDAPPWLCCCCRFALAFRRRCRRRHFAVDATLFRLFTH